MKEGTLLIESLKTIWICLTTIWCIVNAIWWRGSTLVNLAIKILFWLLAISGIIFILYDLHVLNINITWVIK